MPRGFVRSVLTLHVFPRCTKGAGLNLLRESIVARKSLRSSVQLNRRFYAGTYTLCRSLICGFYRRGVLYRRFKIRTMPRISPYKGNFRLRAVLQLRCNWGSAPSLAKGLLALWNPRQRVGGAAPAYSLTRNIPNFADRNLKAHLPTYQV